MKETMSLVLATAILAVGGLGLYMYKQSDDFKDGELEDDKYNDFSSDSDSDLGSDLDSQLEEEYEEDFIDYEPKTNQKAKAKTKRSKTTGGTRKKKY
jgi:hypothetical protein